MQHNFFPAILMTGGFPVALHYSTVVQSGGALLWSPKDAVKWENPLLSELHCHCLV